MHHLLRRLGFYLIAAWASLTLNFLLPRLMPGDAATAMLGRFQGRLQPEAVAALKEAFGLSDAPLAEQYLRYLAGLLSGDLGVSVIRFPEPVIDVVAEGLGFTLLLSGTAVVVSFVLGTLFGILAAWWRGGWLDRLLPPVLAFLGAFPYFWLAMVALYVFGFTLGWFPLRHAYDTALGAEPSLELVGSVLEHLVLPAGSIVVATLGGWMLGMRNTMVGVLAEDYVALAEAKGLSAFRVVWHYAARNALLPNVTSFGMALGFVLSGSLLTEIVFAYPGQGYLLLQAVSGQDYQLLQGCFLAITAAVLAANFLVDVAYVWLDPRTRTER